MSFEIKQATRQGIKPLIVFYSESGCGKTYSALLTARGMVGPKGRICVVDTESGRASLYADLSIFGGYEVLNLTEPFSPARYCEAHQAVVSAGFDIVVYDSGSHEWEGVSGVLDMAAEAEGVSGRPGLHNWKKPKFEHAKFVQTIIRSSIPVIVCLRAKYKSRQLKGTVEMFEAGEIQRNQIGKTIILKDHCTSPIQAEDFIFEATCHGEIMPDHSLRLTKWSHPTLKSCFPDNKPIELKHGALIAEWCNGKPNTGNETDARILQSKIESIASPLTEADVSTLKKELWKLTEKIHGGNKSSFRQHLVDNCKLSPEKPVESLTAEELQKLIATVKGKAK